MNHDDIHARTRDGMARQQAEDAARQAAEREAIERPIREAAAARAAGGGGTNALARIRRGAAKNQKTFVLAPTTAGLISNQMTGPSYGSSPNARSRYR